MNILAIHNYYRHRGGEDFVFESEVKYLKKRGHKVITYTRNNNEIDSYNFFKKIFFFKKAFNNSKTVKDIKKLLKKNKIDIAHIHNVFPLISPSIYKILKKNNIKIVQTLHNYRFLCPNGLFYTKGHNCILCMEKSFFQCIKYTCYKNSVIFSILYAMIIKVNQKIFKQNIDRYIALTEYFKNIFKKTKYDLKKITVKDNGLERNLSKRSGAKNYFLYLGRISKEKGIEFLLESFSKMPEYNLIIAGSGDDLDKYKKNYDKYNNRNIKFYGFVAGKDKNKLIKESSCLIIPSVWYENYPMTIVEAFSFGIPVIASKIGGIPFIISHNKNGLLFKTSDFNDLKKNIDLFLKKRLRNRLGNNAKKTFLERMELSGNIKILENIYKEVLNEK